MNRTEEAGLSKSESGDSEVQVGPTLRPFPEVRSQFLIQCSGPARN